MRRIVLVSLLAVLGAAALPAAASAASGAHEVFAASEATPQGRLAVKVDVERFRSTKAGPVADGVATATLRSFGEPATTVRKKVSLQVSRRGSCRILTLTLDKLDLTLLGLNVHLDKVDLRVTGRRRGGVLGALFCSLARARVNPARVAAVARLNQEVRRTGRLRPVAFSVPVAAVVAQAAAPTCDVLDLVLGPLHVDLLGLVVDLKQVHLTITADPAGGVLGRLFCGLANAP
jgi:hypothetical protein